MSEGNGTVEPKRTGSAGRVLAFLESHGLADGLVHFEQSTKTAQMAADAMGCELGQIVKSLVFVADGRPLLALVAGDRRGDSAAIAALMEAGSAAFADAETVRSATGFAIGGVSPFALPADLPVFIDESLTRFEVIYPAGGTPSSMVRMTLPKLIEITGGQLCEIAR
ncbi:MAG: aminoacyl-tRNA deacylase [Actinobacteria bacterium HGW-Actinobacteria-1]|jgi:prolyl-tRNA editing enzyme YbaK/EbsC (Cys-tRNA(Pro) deacylase)|nr:MAG: aminoacyl-tRNA deacylase [Actinobacteria bacterium HGW-Actinobacteria-1]